MNFDYAVPLYEKERMPEEVARYERAQEERERFLARFPVDRIKSLSLEEYAFVNSKDGDSDSFCTTMYSGLENIAHTGNAYTDMFGIYYKQGKKLALSRTYDKLSGNDYQKAFDQVKTDICDLIIGVQNDDYRVVEKSPLHRMFRYKILAVYFPNKFLPVCTSTMMEPICNTMGVTYGNREMVYSNIDLRRKKESSPLTRNWNNGVFLGFCRWLSERSLVKRMSVMASRIDEELESLNLIGEERETVVKTRVNQGIFRDILLDRYPSCALCKVSDKALLIASHIKPWKDSSPEEKIDVDNGFIFCPNHDRLFDKGFISFDSSGQIMISKMLDEVNRTYTNVREGMKIELTEGNVGYLEFHRDNVYRPYGDSDQI